MDFSKISKILIKSINLWIEKLNYFCNRYYSFWYLLKNKQYINKKDNDIHTLSDNYFNISHDSLILFLTQISDIINNNLISYNLLYSEYKTISSDENINKNIQHTSHSYDDGIFVVKKELNDIIKEINILLRDMIYKTLKFIDLYNKIGVKEFINFISSFEFTIFISEITLHIIYNNYLQNNNVESNFLLNTLINKIFNTDNICNDVKINDTPINTIEKAGIQLPLFPLFALSMNKLKNITLSTVKYSNWSKIYNINTFYNISKLLKLNKQIHTPDELNTNTKSNNKIYKLNALSGISKKALRLLHTIEISPASDNTSEIIKPNASEIIKPNEEDIKNIISTFDNIKYYKMTSRYGYNLFKSINSINLGPQSRLYNMNSIINNNVMSNINENNEMVVENTKTNVSTISLLIVEKFKQHIKPRLIEIKNKYGLINFITCNEEYDNIYTSYIFDTFNSKSHNRVDDMGLYLVLPDEGSEKTYTSEYNLFNLTTISESSINMKYIIRKILNTEFINEFDKIDYSSESNILQQSIVIFKKIITTFITSFENNNIRNKYISILVNNNSKTILIDNILKNQL